jgi:hypothetical protein
VGSYFSKTVQGNPLRREHWSKEQMRVAKGQVMGKSGKKCYGGSQPNESEGWGRGRRRPEGPWILFSMKWILKRRGCDLSYVDHLHLSSTPIFLVFYVCPPHPSTSFFIFCSTGA